MPALYTHNKFGKMVLRNLSPSLKKIIQKYPRAFRLGLQGPDILFFYKPWSINKINKTGTQMHKEDSYDFFETALNIVRKTGADSGYHSYILGLICHYSLDKACHPVVEHIMKKSNCGHLEVECDLERHLLMLDDKTPHTYEMNRLIPSDIITVSYAVPFYKNLNPVEIYTSIKHMKNAKKLLLASCKTKQTVLDCLLRITFHYKLCKGLVLMPDSNPLLTDKTLVLYDKLLSTIPVTTQMIDNFESSLYINCPLSDDFHGNYYGID